MKNPSVMPASLLGTVYAIWLSTEDSKEWLDENTTTGVVSERHVKGLIVARKQVVSVCCAPYTGGSYGIAACSTMPTL
jgi:hypothetical protein